MSILIYAPTLVDDDQGLRNVQWVYLGVACFVGLPIVLFLLVPFPEITGKFTALFLRSINILKA
jgi:hypothetical protein